LAQQEKSFFAEREVPLLLQCFLEKEKWRNYLDLGCGHGSLLFALNKKGYFKGKKVYAVDLSEKRIAAVKKTSPSFNCLVADACKLKGVKNSGIDFLVSTQVIEHVESEEQMIKEMRRVLRSNGIAFVSTVFKKKTGMVFLQMQRQMGFGTNAPAGIY